MSASLSEERVAEADAADLFCVDRTCGRHATWKLTERGTGATGGPYESVRFWCDEHRPDVPGD